MKNIGIFLLVILLAGAGYYYYTADSRTGGPENTQEQQQTTDTEMDNSEMQDVSVTPIEHASAVLSWGDTTVYMDPVGGGEAYSGQPAPDVVVITHTHGDHLSAETLSAVVSAETRIIAPQVVADELPEALRGQTTVMANGETADVAGLSVEAIPMYNLPEAEDAYHVKGDGNGYVLEMGGTRVYVAGDTEDIPEMRNLQDIDIAFVPMNLPYTMDVESAAEGVLAFAPDTVYPYHYRNRDDTLSDVERFRQLVNEENPDIEVILATSGWYPNREE